MRETKPDYIAIARFRSALRAFERAAEDAAREAGLTPQRYLLLLMVKGALGAVSRAEAAGLLVRERCTEDRRRMWISLTAEGDRRLARVVGALERQRAELVDALDAAAREVRSA